MPTGKCNLLDLRKHLIDAGISHSNVQIRTPFFSFTGIVNSQEHAEQIWRDMRLAGNSYYAARDTEFKRKYYGGK